MARQQVGRLPVVLGDHDDHGLAVVAVDNLITGKRENVAHLVGRADFELVLHDVSKPIEIAGAVDYVLHFASPASPIDYLRLPLHTLKVGSHGTHHALGLAKHHRARFLLEALTRFRIGGQRAAQHLERVGHLQSGGDRGGVVAAVSRQPAAVARGDAGVRHGARHAHVRGREAGNAPAEASSSTLTATGKAVTPNRENVHSMANLIASLTKASAVCRMPNQEEEN